MSSTTPTEVVSKLLKNTLNPEVVRELVAPDATYVSLNYDNPDLTKILPYAGSHTKAGPQAIIDTFATVNRIWANEAFEIQTLFGAGKDVAVFGSFTYRSRSLGKVSVSPFSIWCKVNEDGKVTYMQFMEDTLGSTDSFKKGGQKQYVVFKEKGEIEVQLNVERGFRHLLNMMGEFRLMWSCTAGIGSNGFRSPEAISP